MSPVHANSTRLLGVDQHASVLLAIAGAGISSRTYAAYGSHPCMPDELATLAYNGHVSDRPTGWYLLGNGYRAYNPMLMRFVSPDDMSPFGGGGLNGYGYCHGDPINREDPTGHFGLFRALFTPLRRIARFAGLTSKRTAPAAARSSVVVTAPEASGFAAWDNAGLTQSTHWSPKPLLVEFPQAPYPRTLLGRRNAIRPNADVPRAMVSRSGQMRSPDFERYQLLARPRARTASLASERKSPLPIQSWDGTRDFRQPSGITHRFKPYTPQVPAPRPYPIQERLPMPLPSDIRNA